jgi:hypothetical protein
MHPEVASAMAHARHQDLQRSAAPHRVSDRRPLSRTPRRRWRLLSGVHLPLISHRTRLGH